MKKILALALAAAMSLSLVACGSNDKPAASTPAASTPAASGDAAEKGSVYYLNFKPEADAAWQELAKQYTAEFGVDVKVVTAASGEYSTTLTAEMAKSEAPTLFQCGNAQGLIDWGDYCIDFTGTKVLDEMTTGDFNLTDENGAVKAIGYCYEAFGIIVNKALLAEAGYSVEDITNFETLKAVAEDIHARADELGFDAFSSAGLDGSSSWRFSGHLANMPLYYEGVNEMVPEITGEQLDLFRNIWDLYITDTAADPATLTTSTGDESTGQFKAGEAVFYQNGTWEFAGLVEAGLSADQLAMIPIYCGADGEEEAGLCSGTENCWAVNAKASEEDIAATLDFIAWVVTSDEGTNMMAEQFGPIPFKNAKASSNVFFNNANEYMANGNYTVTWAFNHTPNVDSWRATVVTALAAYSADPSDANWEGVVSAFVDGWAIEYATVNG